MWSPVPIKQEDAPAAGGVPEEDAFPTMARPSNTHNPARTFLATMILFAGLGLALPAHAEALNDVRILIDVSGSMKHNDPDNLRIPALKLITGLLPRDSRAGVWTFGRYVNMLVPLATVDEDWRRRALAAADRISSHGLFTDMEATLADATWDWRKPAPEGERRSLILLTDGYVDVSTDKEKNAASRQRILDSILPRLQRAGVTIHTIALSKEADQLLLRQLATTTGGRYEQADARELERLFFHLFETATEPETLPLVDNRVLVDEHVRELTLLVFRRSAARATRLVTPGGKSFGEDSAPANVHWHHEARYDLVTITGPEQGEWTVQADTDPDNRVMVVTDFNVIATRLPENLAAGDRYTFLVRLTDRGRVIEKKDFLHFIRVSATQESDTGRRHHWLLLDNGRRGDAAPGDGIYTLHLDKTLRPGAHRLTVDVDGTTFRRRLTRSFHVYRSPVEVFIDEEATPPVLHVIPRAGMIDPENLTLTAVISSGGETLARRTIPRHHPGRWRLPLEGLEKGRRHAVQVLVRGRRPDGRPVEARTPVIRFGAPSPAPPPAEEPARHRPAPTPPSESSGAGQEAVNWLWVAFQVVLLNFLAIASLVFAYRKWLRFEVQIPQDWHPPPQEQQT